MLKEVTQNIRREMLGRMRKDTPHYGHFARAINLALDIADNVNSEEERINNDGRFTTQGRQEYLAEATRVLAPKLAKGAGQDARSARLQNESKQVALGRPELAKDDLIGELQRQEVRTYVRNQPSDKRVQVAFELAQDKKMGEAIFFGNGQALIGLPKEQFDAAKRVFLNHHYNEDLAEHEAMKEDISAVSSAVQHAFNRLFSISGMNNVQFTSYWQDLEAEAARYE